MADMKQHYQLAVIGAGPAGLAAATTAAERGAEVAVFDEQGAPGGQIYRATESIPEQRAEQLGSEYQRGRELISAFRACGAQYFPTTQVWSLNGRREIGLLDQGGALTVTADQVIIGGGAMERPVPFPGWTLAGVMNAGAGQILFKSHGIVPDDGVVLAGSGPLLLLLAWQYLHAGVRVGALLDLTPMLNHLLALPKLPRALLAGHYITKGLKYKRELRRAGVSTMHNVRDLRAKGQNTLQSVSFVHNGRERSLETDLLLVHFGVIPHTQLARVAGCRHVWDDSQLCWRPQLDEWGRTSVEGIFIAGDGGGIGGARSAEHAGRLAAFQALYALGVLDREAQKRLSRMDRKWMREELHIRPFLESFFRISDDLLQVRSDDTLVCRCEEVTAGEIRAAVAQGHLDSNQVKFLTRCGMGACQGRQCAEAVSHIVAAASGKPVEEVGHYRERPPVNPLTLGQLASLFPEETE
jgi:NADPH-dependent 2,4-dienoyl-CoA reductase/sulfur reductase-like enzyme